MFSAISFILFASGGYCFYLSYTIDRASRKKAPETKNAYSMDYSSDFSNKYSGTLPLDKLAFNHGDPGRTADEDNDY